MTATEVKVACQAMATRFEVLLYGEDHTFLRAAGEEAVHEIERLDRKLSYFRPDSGISRINRAAARAPVVVDPELFGLLADCARFWRESKGGFDITLSPLFEAWGMRAKEGRHPDEQELASLRANTGMERLVLVDSERTVRFGAPGMKIDLGAVGKGFALETAANALREAGVQSALLHGGTSSVVAVGRPPEGEAWQVAIRLPEGGASTGRQRTVELRDNSLGVSAPSGRMFSAAGKERGHLFSAESGSPVERSSLAAVICQSASRADALATGLAAGGERLFEEWQAQFPDVAAMLVLDEGEAGHRQLCRGM